MRLAWIVVVAVACKGKGSAPATGSASASGSATVADAATAAPVDAAAVPTGKLEFDTDADSMTDNVGLAIAFDKRVPKLPAISADGNWIADYASDVGGMMSQPFPYHATFTPLDEKSKAVELPLIDVDLSVDAQNNQEDWNEKPPKGALLEKLRKRGAAVVAKLQADNYTTLAKVEVPEDNGDPKPAKVGAFTLSSAKKDGARSEYLEVTLAKDSKVVRRVKIDSYSDGVKPASFAGGSCQFTPMFDAAYTAGDRLYVAVRFRFNEECMPQPVRYLVWPLAGDDPEGELFTMFAEQFDAGVEMESHFAPDAVFVIGNELRTENIPYIVKANGEIYQGHEGNDIVVTFSRDGKTAWVSGRESLSILPPNEKGRDDEWRATNLAIKTPKGWRFIATTWTQPFANAKANKDAKAGKLKPQAAFTVDKGDAGLNEAFAKLLADGVDADARANANLVAFGSGPGERTVGGAVLAKGLDAGWKGKAAVSSSVARLAPSGTTGWVAANVELSKGTYKIPFRIFAVFDKTTAGAWTLVHLHFAI